MKALREGSAFTFDRPLWRFSSAEPKASVSVTAPSSRNLVKGQHPVDLLMGVAVAEGFTAVRSIEEELGDGRSRFTVICEREGAHR